MKRLLNDGYDAVEELLDGYVKAHGDVVKLADNERVVVRTTLSPQPKVGIIFGGGSGHEPLFLGYVGEGVADAAVIASTVFFLVAIISLCVNPDHGYAPEPAIVVARGVLSTDK